MLNVQYPRSRLLLRAGFWLALMVSTYFAVMPLPEGSGMDVGDVALHAIAFTVLTFTLMLAYLDDRWLVCIAYMCGYALFVEGVQTQIPERYAEVKDLVVDGIGISVGLLLYKLLGRWTLRTVQSLFG